MKAQLLQPKTHEKPIKYKQFIQQLQNSSRSSNHDQSLLSQRSFRESHTARDFHDQLRNQTSKKTALKQSHLISSDLQNSYRMSQPLNQIQSKACDANDKLYTFCDAKITQRSIEIASRSNGKSNNSQKKVNQPVLSGKYFKTNKPRNEQKQNIEFVNKILEKMQSGGFEGKVLKTQNSQLEKVQSTAHKNIDVPSMQKKQSSGASSLIQSSSNRKIQSVKKIFVSRQSSNRVSDKKASHPINVSQCKSRENSQTKNGQKAQNQKQSQQKCSSKKKIVSLNINSLKNNANPSNSVRMKLSLDKSSDKLNQSKQKSFNGDKRSNLNMESRGSLVFNIQSRGSLVEGRMLSSSLQKMPSLDQSKIESMQNEGSRSNLLMSGGDLSELTQVLAKESQRQQLHKLQRTVEQLKERERKMNKQIYELNQKLKHSHNAQDKREAEILQKDCGRLTNSYKEMKKLYELTVRDKEELERKLQNLQAENQDLKECLDFKSNEAERLDKKTIEMAKHIQQLHEELENRAFPPELEGLSDIIKEKLGHYELQIQSLLDSNHKLTLLREKLENYNQTLKEQIQEKDTLIQSLEKHLKQVTTFRRSTKEQIGDYRQNQLRLNKLCKELESKLKLSNIHNEYLTQEIVTLKQEKKQLISSNPTQNDGASLKANDSLRVKPKFKSMNTLANTITTRNSSMSHAKDFDHLPHRLQKDKQFEGGNYEEPGQVQ